MGQGRKLLLAAAAALLAGTLSATAEPNAAAPAVTSQGSASMALPTPRPRPGRTVHRRTASAAPVRQATQPVPFYYWLFPRYERPAPERVAVHWPILFIGVGF